jgi:hypothetical protein
MSEGAPQSVDLKDFDNFRDALAAAQKLGIAVKTSPGTYISVATGPDPRKPTKKRKGAGS